MIEKAEIVDAIRRCAERNGGVPLGRERFEDETGISQTDWLGRYWARWGDAIRDAGFEPNVMMQALDEEAVLTSFAQLTRELGHFPTHAERRMRRQTDPSFPSHGVFTRFGDNAALVARMVAFCRERERWDDVRGICESIPLSSVEDRVEPDSVVRGVVYLVRSGRFYKIGRSNAVGRRAYELAIQLPERLKLVHAIETDDPVGIERYWHGRFADRRGNGEWFTLTAEDVAAFRRRRRFM